MTGMQGRSGTNHGWPDERVEELKRQVDEHFSAGKIADNMGMTRNMVVGKLHRLGLSTAGSTTGKERCPRPAAWYEPSKPKRGPSVTATSLLRLLLRERPEAPDLPPDQSPCAVTILDLNTHTCRWPIGEPSHVMSYCGAEPFPGVPYCSRHACLAYKPAAAR